MVYAFTQARSAMSHSNLDELGIEAAPGSWAQLSNNPATDRAVIFVHGFGGHPRKTWVDFQSLTDTLSAKYPWWQTTDLYFLKYRSVADHIADSSKRMRRFVGEVFPVPPDRLFMGPLSKIQPNIRIRPGPYAYKSLVLVAHSEGGLVTRLMLIDVVKDWKDRKTTDHDPILKAALRLFAPAHLGASPSGLLGVLAGSIAIGDLIRTGLLGSPAYNEMQQNSQILQPVRERTEELADKFEWMTALHALIAWGEKDQVVTKGEFWTDRRFPKKNQDVPGKGHVSVCKPRDNYRLPLEFVSYDWIPGTEVSFP
jgi:hypothetical protein